MGSDVLPTRCVEFCGNSRPMKRAPILGAALLLPLFWMAEAKAAEPPPADDSGPEKTPPPVPYQPDGVGGHFLLGVTGNFAVPFGHLAEEVSYRDRAGDGWGGLVDVGFGLDRYVVLGAYGEALWLGDSTACMTCSATSFGAGGFVRYHFAQGLRIDPWISYGIGFRQLSTESVARDHDYSGLEWFRLQLGATWSILPQLGLGPVMQFTGATMLATPDGQEIGGSSWTFQLGIRMSLDLPGR